MIVTAVEIAHPDYIIRTWHVYLVMLTLLIVEGCLASESTVEFISQRSRELAAIELTGSEYSPVNQVHRSLEYSRNRH